jgi:hypothetical protein
MPIRPVWTAAPLQGKKKADEQSGRVRSLRAAGEAIQLPAPMKQPAVYIMASRRNCTLYTGPTSNLVQRAHQHRGDQFPASPPDMAASCWSGMNGMRR